MSAPAATVAAHEQRSSLSHVGRRHAAVAGSWTGDYSCRSDGRCSHLPGGRVRSSVVRHRRHLDGRRFRRDHPG
jgi:hypothetical protein